MKNSLFIFIFTVIICLTIVGVCLAGGWSTHTYEALTNTAWTTTTSTPVVVAGTTVVGNFTPTCNHFRVWEHTKTMKIWHSYTANLSGAWILTSVGEVYDSEMNVPRNGIYVYVSSTATIDFESAR
jgi:hypothetical protein